MIINFEEKEKEKGKGRAPKKNLPKNEEETDSKVDNDEENRYICDHCKINLAYLASCPKCSLKNIYEKWIFLPNRPLKNLQERDFGPVTLLVAKVENSTVYCGNGTD